MQDAEPHGNVQHAQANYGEAHDGAGGECNAQALVQALISSLSGTRIGVGSDLHADETSQHGEHTTGDECEGGKLGQHLAARGKCHNEKDNEHNGKHLANGHVLMLQVSICTVPDGLCDFDHLVVTFRVLHDDAALNKCEDQCNHSADEAQQKQVFQQQTTPYF